LQQAIDNTVLARGNNRNRAYKFCLLRPQHYACERLVGQNY